MKPSSKIEFQSLKEGFEDIKNKSKETTENSEEVSDDLIDSEDTDKDNLNVETINETVSPEDDTDTGSYQEEMKTIRGQGVSRKKSGF
jgi:hypothetical protein